MVHLAVTVEADSHIRLEETFVMAGIDKYRDRTLYMKTGEALNVIPTLFAHTATSTNFNGLETILFKKIFFKLTHFKYIL